MSRAYRVVLETAARNVHSKDEVSTDLALLGILAEDEMKGLLEETLLADGWKRRGKSLVREFGPVEAEISEDRKRVTMRLEREEQVTAKARTKGEAKARADEQAERAKHRMEKEVTRELAEMEATVRESVQTALQKVYVAALEKKARSMGEVESIDRREGDDGIEVVIKVKV